LQLQTNIFDRLNIKLNAQQASSKRDHTRQSDAMLYAKCT